MKTENTTNLHPEDVRPGVYLISEYGKPFKVSGVWCSPVTDAVEIFEYVNHGQMKRMLPECFGIPLNDAVLQAAGFTETKSQWYKVWNESGNIFALNKVEDWLEFTSHNPDLTELHLLQNLYRSLTRTDLTINAAKLSEAVKVKNETR